MRSPNERRDELANFRTDVVSLVATIDDSSARSRRRRDVEAELRWNDSVDHHVGGAYDEVSPTRSGGGGGGDGGRRAHYDANPHTDYAAAVEAFRSGLGGVYMVVVFIVGFSCWVSWLTGGAHLSC